MSDRADGNRTVGMTELEYRVIAGRECRVDTDMTEDNELMVIVYDAETGVVIATSSEPMGLDAQLTDLENDVLANGW